MESTVAHPAWWLQAYAWADARKKQLLYGGVAIAVVALVVAYYLYNRGQRDLAASEALSAAGASGQALGAKGEKPEAYLRVASDYAGTTAAAQALLRAGTAYFAEGKHAEALRQFERFIRENRQSPLLGQALFGVAVCLDAQGKPTDAVEKYRNLIDRRPNDSMIPQTKLNLARLYESQNKPEQAKTLYEEVARAAGYGNTGTEAAVRLNTLLARHPELAVPKSGATNAPAINLGTP